MDEWVDGFVDDLMGSWVDCWWVKPTYAFPACEPKLETSGISSLARPKHEGYIEQGP